MKTFLAAFIFGIWGLVIAPTSAADRRLAGDLSSSYSWGDFQSPEQSSDSHSGVATKVYLGYRILSSLSVGVTGLAAFPQISVTNSLEDASFTYWGVGAEIDWLWKNRVEFFSNFLPYTRLSQSIHSRLGVGRVETDSTYSGMSFGGGFKFYLTNPNKPNAQIGLRFGYSRDRYRSLDINSHLENSNEHPTPNYSPMSVNEEGSPLLSGNTYQLGLFIGL